MADNKKYYYLKLKDNFFESDSMVILESMENGYVYSNILLKMYLRSLKSDGRLLFNDRIPYNPTMLAKIVRHNVDIVEKAIKLFKEFELIDILDNGAIYMLEIQNYIGESSSEADRKRDYRNKISGEKLLSGQISGQISGQMSDKSTPEIEIELKIDREIEKELKTEIEIEYNIITSKVNFDQMQQVYNQYCTNLPQVKEKTEKRVKAVNTFNKQFKSKSLETFEEICKYANRNTFLCGQTASKDYKNWKANFDWIINVNNAVKILEGKYEQNSFNNMSTGMQNLALIYLEELKKEDENEESGAS